MDITRIKMHLKINLLILILQTVNCLLSYGNNGLIFKSNDHRIADRTSYHLFDSFKKVYGDSIFITFNMQIESNKHYGHILNVRSGKEQYNMIFVNFRDKEKSFIDFNVNSTDKISFPFEKSYFEKGKWHQVTIKWNFLNNQIIFCIDENYQVIDHIFDKKDRKYELVFGLYNKYVDVPELMIKDVIFYDGKKSQHFPLNESSGNVVHDISGKKTGTVLNPDWAMLYSRQWALVYETRSDEIYGATFDSLSHNLILYNHKETTRLNIQNGDISSIKNDTNKCFEIVSGGMIILDSNRVFIYNTRPKDHELTTKAIYNFETGDFVSLGRSAAKSKLHHHVVFTDRSMNNIYLFGGYGTFKYSNEFLKLNVMGNEPYERIEFSGDTISPRFFSAVGTDLSKNNNLAYIFGGFGNESGSQEDGARYFYDFYRIDLSQRHISRLFNLTDVQEDFVPISNLIISSSDDTFFAFCYPQHQPKAKGYIYKFSMDGKYYERVTDSLLILSERIKTQVSLFPDYQSGKLILVKQEFVDVNNSTLQIYTISYPMKTETIPQEIHNRSQNIVLVFTLISVLGSIIVVFIIYQRRNIKLRSENATILNEIVSDKKNPDIVQLNESIVSPRHRKNAIFLLGEFVVHDRNSRDITHRFSPKIRQLFLLIFFNSSEKDNGITSESLSQLLWPGRSAENAKNVRGVTISNLRDIIADIDGIELKWEYNRWLMDVDYQIIYCDYITLMEQTIESIDNSINDTKYIDMLVELLSRGNLLPNYSERWLDPIKLNFEEKMVSIMTHVLNYLLKVENYITALKLSSALLRLDPLNEDIFRVEMFVLQALGRQDQAVLKFHIFKNEYFDAYKKEIDLRDYIKN